MTLVGALRLHRPASLAAVGAGGKTSALFQIARQLIPPVWLTTTTHLGLDQLSLADRHILFPCSPGKLASVTSPGAGVVVFTSLADADRAAGLTGPDLEVLRQAAADACIPLLVEADGSRMLPLKAPAAHEPVIPVWVDQVIVVAGLSGLGKPLDDASVHRPEIFASLGGLLPGELVSLEALGRVLRHGQGGLKGIPASARRIVLLNQADTLVDLLPVYTLASKLLDVYDVVITASLANDKIYAVHEPYAGILLAAGESRRMQKPKQLMPWRGEPLVRVAAKNALAGGCTPLIVVTGAYAEEVEASLIGLPVTVVNNPVYREGQSASIRAGLAALPERTGSVFFFLADQPQIPPALVRQLASCHALRHSAVLAPRVQGRRANPVLFDRDTFAHLMQLSGDTGGRAIFDRFPPDFLDWDDLSILLDVDSPADYMKLMDIE